jgi:hypothetical protein
MLIARIEGFTREIGKSQGYRGLPVRDETIVDGATGERCNAMTTAWEPTPQELKHLIAGGKVYLRVLGTGHPPVALWAEGPKS